MISICYGNTECTLTQPVFGMMTISAVSFLANVSNKPIALMITQFEGQMQLECAAFVSLLILAVNVLLKVVIYFIKKATNKI